MLSLDILRFENIPASAARVRRIKRFSHWRKSKYTIPFAVTRLSVAELIKVIGLQSQVNTIDYLARILINWPALYRLVVATIKLPVFRWLGGIWVLLVKRYKGGLVAKKMLQFPLSVYFRALLFKSTILSRLLLPSSNMFIHDDSD